jgi:hypothetical protein
VSSDGRRPQPVADLTFVQLRGPAVGLPEGWVPIQTTMQTEMKPVVTQGDPVFGTGQTTATPVATGRYYLDFHDPKNPLVSTRVYFNKGAGQPAEVARSAAGEAHPGLDAPINPNAPPTETWSVSEAAEAVPASATKTPPTKAANLVRLDINGTPIPEGNTQTKVVKLYDEATGEYADMPASTSPGGTPVKLGSRLVVVFADGTVQDTGMTVPTDKSAVNVPGVGAFSYDPSTGVFTPGPQAKPEPKYEIRNGTTYVQNPDDPSKWVATDLPKQDAANSIYNDPDSQFIVYLDDKGQEVGRYDKSQVGWQPKLEDLATNTEARVITKWDPASQSVKEFPNPNRLTASEAIIEMAKSLGIAVANGDMTEAQAQNLIKAHYDKQAAETAATTAAAATMSAEAAKQNAQTAAARLPIEQQQANAQMLQAQGALAGGIADVGQAGLTAINQAAQTGAGMLQSRAAGAANLLSNVNQSFMGSQAIRAPNVAGPGLASAIGNWMTELGGGADTYTAAANMVRRADPSGAMGADASKYFGAMGQALEKYQQLTGQPHPLAAATAQEAPSQGGMTAPGGPEPQLGQVTQIEQPPGPVVANSIGGPMQTYGRFPESAAMSQQRNAALLASGAYPTPSDQFKAPVTINLSV